MKQLLRLAVVSVVLSTLTTGCADKREPIAIAVIVNKTDSAEKRRDQGMAWLRLLLQGGYLPKGSQVAIVRDDCSPEVVYDGPVLVQEVMAKFDEAFAGGFNCGNNTVQALEEARRFLKHQEAKGLRRLIICGWDDLREEACHRDGGLRRFAATEQMVWPASKNIELLIYGVPSAQAELLESLWAPKLKSIALYSNAHRIRPEDLGLTKTAIF